MEFFDSLVLPQSSEHIALLQFIQMLIYFIFLPFSGLLLSGTAISVFYKRKGEKENNHNFILFAKEVIETVTVNKSAGFILGIVPALSTVLIYAQLLHASNSYIISFLFLAFLLYTTGLILIYIYRYAFVFNEVFSGINKFEKHLEDDDEFSGIINGSNRLKNIAGIYGIIFMALSVLLIFGSISLSIYPVMWNKIHNIFALVFSAGTFIRFFFFISASFALTGGYLLFIMLYWEGGNKKLNNTLKALTQNASVKLVYVFAILQPVFLLLSLLILPNESLSTTLFGLTFLGIIILFLVYNFTYVMVKESKIKFSGYIFILLACAFIIGIIKDQLAMSNSTAIHSLALNVEYEKYLKTMQSEGGTENLGVSGEEVYKRICSSCHRFDQKLVGPPYKETLPKYEGKMDQLIAFIKNPVKKNPNYPPMPAQGLKPNEIKAVAKYILDTYKK